MKRILLALNLFPLLLIGQNIPKMGNDTLLEVAAWNIEWFGDATNGPSDKTLQFNNVKAVLEKTDMDVWGLAEMSNTISFTNLTNALPKYASVNSTISQTQKMCLFYKKDMFNFINSEHILTSSNYDFASRPPLMVTLATKGDSLQIDTMYFIVVHLKANTGTAADKLESYNRRKRAADALKTYIESSLKNRKYFILGDWNDRLDLSIHNNSDPTPFKQLLDAKYNFISKPLSDAGKRSYVSGGFIDHIMISPRIDSFYIKQSAGVFDNIGTYISNYSNTTSDHYPVFGKFRFNKKLFVKPKDSIPNDTIPNDTINTSIKIISDFRVVKVYPNPFTGTLNITSGTTTNQNTLFVYNQIGQLLYSYTIDKPFVSIDTEGWEKGLYHLRMDNTYYKVAKE